MDKRWGYRLSLAVGLGFIVFLIGAQTSGVDFVGNSIKPLRELIGGHDPYLHEFTVFSVPYPLPALLLGLPFLPFSDPVAGALFLALATGVLVVVITRDGQYWRLLILASYPFLESVVTVQYTPLLALAIVLPALWAWPFLLIKPQVALAGVVMDKPSQRSLLIMAGMLLLSVLVIPLWPLEWLRSLAAYQSMIPLLAPLGWLMGLALVHWRKREYRGLLALAALPKRGMYDNFYVGLLARDGRELLVFVALSWLPVVSYTVLGINTVILLYLAPLAMWLWKDRVPAKVEADYLQDHDL